MNITGKRQSQKSKSRFCNKQEQYMVYGSVTVKTIHLRAIQRFTIHFVLLPVGHLTSSVAVPDTLTGVAAERSVAFEAIGTVVG